MEAGVDSEAFSRAVVRVWRGQPTKGGRFQGTAFFVNPTVAITASHVALPESIGDLFIAATWNGGFEVRVQQVVSHPRNEIDIALLRVAAESSAPPGDVCRRPPRSDPIRIGDELQMLGFADAHGTLETRKGSATAIDGEASAVVVSPYPARGMSGGPVLSLRGFLRGVIWARDVDKGRAYVTPLSQFDAFLEHEGITKQNERQSGTASIEDLRSYASHVILDFSQARTRELASACAAFHPDSPERELVIGEANELRSTIDADVDDGGLISINQLPPATVPAERFWQAALELARVKSARTHAAVLLTALRKKPMNKRHRVVFDEVLERLRNVE